MAFRGHFDYSLDAKNRLNVPPKFRAAFSDGLVLAKWLDPCVAIFTPEGFEAFTESFLPSLSPLSAQHRKLSRYFAGTSFDAELDSAGRVTLNQKLLDHARISKDVVVVGNRDHLEVWAREGWESAEGDLDAEITEIAETVGHPS
jgi:MraZ protein